MNEADGVPTAKPIKKSTPTLSVCIITQDMAHFLGRLIAQMNSIADEILVVDGGSRDDTVQVAGTCDKVRLLHRDFEGDMATQKNFAIDHAKGDWVLVMDSDELLGDRAIAMIPKLIRSNKYTHFKLARYWLVGLDPFRYVQSHKHYPDFQLRLFRIMPFFRYSEESYVHTHFPRKDRGPGRRLRSGHIFHFDFLLKGRDARAAKVRRYVALDPTSAVTSQMYLFEDMKHKIRRCRETLGGFDPTGLEFPGLESLEVGQG